MRAIVSRFSFLVLVLSPAIIQAQVPDATAALHWRQIGPTRAGRARALSGVPSQPNVFYIGFDNGGVWRSTDYGSTWQPLFDQQPTGSIGAIAVAPSDPNVIYVGTGAGIIRPDLSIGDGVYKSTDAGKTWTHLGLFDTQMIAMIDVDPKDPNRLFVAALGHPYGPNSERGIFRSTDGGKSFQKVLYKDEYTSGDDVRIDPSNPNIVYAAMWEQQQSYIEGGGFGIAANGIYKSTDGGTTWKQLTEGLPAVGQANIAISYSDPKILYAMVATAAGGGGGGGGRGGRGGGGAPPTVADTAGRGGAGAPGAGGGRGGGTGLYKTTDGGEHWHLAVTDIPGHNPDNRPLGRIGGGDLATLAVDGKNPQVVYSSSTVMWRSEDGGVTWSAVRGAPGGDDYQKTWVNPLNPDIILQVSDQGGVVSANRGKSWSNWYNQPTAAMYHVTADMSFPYNLCGGQQDSGSACVESRSMDGEITFHNWHPVNIQEYGEAAPDPKNPDMVYGSSRNGVSLYNKKTGQTTQVGPDASLKGTANEFGRNVRTMPIIWSPANSDVLFYANSAVFKTSDRGHSWSRISGDLARQTWAVPASTGKYGANVNPAPTGSITALAGSPKSVNVLWAGTDDGTIQVTMNGGAKWTNVTPPAVKPWARVFNMDAGHFDTLTAYAAVNTMRLDDINPHFWRTHDGGKTWTEINSGIAKGAVSNSIREDPRKKGLLYAATDLQVWYSIDDGDHWQSLKVDMPAISVRDIKVKDDSICMCSDLVAGTHGRGFWILDDVTPLRQLADAATSGTYLFKPAPAVRVRFGTNDPTPWPPELPAGENPPPGALIDYYIASTPSQPVKLEILDNLGHTVRTYVSGDKPLDPDPARDPERYNEQCKANAGAGGACALPLYWPAPSVVFMGDKGMHRWSWDMKYDAVGGGGGGRGGGGGGAAVPHRTYGGSGSAWAPPGNYSVKLTVDGKSYTQPITVHLDPRVKTPAIALTQINTITREMMDGARTSQAAYANARALVANLDKSPSAPTDEFKKQVEGIAPAAAAPGGGGAGGRGGRGGRGGGGGAAVPVAALNSVAAAMSGAAMAIQGSEMAPTKLQLDNAAKAKSEYTAIMAKWTALRTTGLASLNLKRKAAGQAAIEMPK